MIAVHRRGLPDPPERANTSCSYGELVLAGSVRGRLAWWDGRVRSLLFDLAVAVAASGLLGLRSPSAPALAICSAVVVAVALLVRRRFPLVTVATGVAVVVTACLAVLVPIASEVPHSPVPMTIGAYTLARRRGSGLPLWIAGGAGVLLQATAQLLQQHDWNQPLAIATNAALYSVPIVAGLWMRQRDALLDAARERIAQAERERELLAERAVAAERQRIAREMHDVVAHRVSAMALQAGALSVRAPDERTGEAAEIIRQNTTSALTELRGMLRVLRDDAADLHSDPADAPAVRDVETLVRDALAAGANVQLDMPDVLPETSDAVGRAAYRVVQEALTNAAKHAPHAAVHVEVAADEDELAVTVANERSRSSAGATAASGSGYGLAGMRERVELAGGSLEAGTTDSGGYRVRGVLPLRTPVVREPGS